MTVQKAAVRAATRGTQTGARAISSVRVGSLRLLWLEAFVAIVEKENISEAARSLGIDQSNVSRYRKQLEQWLGMKLIDPGAVADPDDPRVSIGITKDGREFYNLAESILESLAEFRDDNSSGAEILRTMEQMVCSMEKDRELDTLLPTTTSVNDKIDTLRQLMSSLSDDLPAEHLRTLQREMRVFYNRYEWERNRDIRRSMRKLGMSGAKIQIP